MGKNKKISERLLALRKGFGYSQKAMAEEVGLPFNSYRRYEMAEREPVGGNLSLVEAFLASHEPRAGERADSAELITGVQEEPEPWKLWALDLAQLVAAGYSASRAAQAEPVTVLWLIDELHGILDRGECRSLPVDEGIRGALAQLKQNFHKEKAQVGIAAGFQRAAALAAEFARGCASAHDYQNVLQQFLDTAYFYGWGEFPPKKTL